jgi:hypothetical protein
VNPLNPAVFIEEQPGHRELPCMRRYASDLNINGRRGCLPALGRENIEWPSGLEQASARGWWSRKGERREWGGERRGLPFANSWIVNSRSF